MNVKIPISFNFIVLSKRKKKTLICEWSQIITVIIIVTNQSGQQSLELVHLLAWQTYFE